MASHEDRQHTEAERQIIEEILAARGEQLTREGRNIITAGAPGEQEIRSGIYGRSYIRQLPDDPQAFRISIGRSRGLGEPAYVVLRGDPSECRRLLAQAIEDLDLCGWART